MVKKFFKECRVYFGSNKLVPKAILTDVHLQNLGQGNNVHGYPKNKKIQRYTNRKIDIVQIRETMGKKNGRLAELKNVNIEPISSDDSIKITAEEMTIK